MCGNLRALAYVLQAYSFLSVIAQEQMHLVAVLGWNLPESASQ